MESRAHDVVIMPSEYRYGATALPVPDSDGLIIRSGDDPRVLRVKLHRTNVVQVTQERKQASPELIAPHLNLIIITYDTKITGVSVKSSRTNLLVEPPRVRERS